MASLYDITERYSNVSDLIYSEENEEIDHALLKCAIDSVKDEYDEKMLNIVKFIKNLKGDVAMIGEEEKRLKNKKKILENKLESLEEYLKFGLKSMGYKAYDLGIFKISLRKSEKVHIDSLLDVPNEFLKFLNPEPKNIEIKKAIKAGKKVSGARLVENESLVVR